MKYSYPVNLELQDNGSVFISFPDVPEALTEADSVAEALSEALDGLIAALGGYVDDRRQLPKPSRKKRGQRMVTLPPLMSAKLALHQLMLERKITRVSLGKTLGVTEGAIRRLLDLDHRSHIGQVNAALSALGKEIVLEVRDVEVEVCRQDPAKSS